MKQHILVLLGILGLVFHPFYAAVTCELAHQYEMVHLEHGKGEHFHYHGQVNPSLVIGCALFFVVMRLLGAAGASIYLTHRTKIENLHNIAIKDARQSIILLIKSQWWAAFAAPLSIKMLWFPVDMREESLYNGLIAIFGTSICAIPSWLWWARNIIVLKSGNKYVSEDSRNLSVFLYILLGMVLLPFICLINLLLLDFMRGAWTALAAQIMLELASIFVALFWTRRISSSLRQEARGETCSQKVLCLAICLIGIPLIILTCVVFMAFSTFPYEPEHFDEEEYFNQLDDVNELDL